MLQMSGVQEPFVFSSGLDTSTTRAYPLLFIKRLLQFEALRKIGKCKRIFHVHFPRRLVNYELVDSGSLR